MTRSVKRSYDASRRKLGAEATRRAIVQAARELFHEKGYAGTSMKDIASQAGVSVDTVYASTGKKPELFRMLIESAISGDDQAVPAERRDYVKAVRAAAGAEEKLRIYVDAICEIHQRLAPLLVALQAAAPSDPSLNRIWDQISERRAKNMELFARDLLTTDELRTDLSLQDVSDSIWATNSPELFLMLTARRGWSVDRYNVWLLDLWRRTLLA